MFVDERARGTYAVDATTPSTREHLREPDVVTCHRTRRAD
jgi:hypothetical protein